MKKELNNLLSVGCSTRYLKINGAFTVKAVPVDEIGNAVEIFHTKPDHMVLYLIYTLAHDKFLYRQRDLKSTTAAGLMEEIPAAMASILDENKNDLVKAFMCGYLG